MEVLRKKNLQPPNEWKIAKPMPNNEIALLLNRDRWMWCANELCCVCVWVCLIVLAAVDLVLDDFIIENRGDIKHNHFDTISND